MNVVHLTWIPEDTEDFIQSGRFYLWVESDEFKARSSKPLHPEHLQGQALADFLSNALLLGNLAEDSLTTLNLTLPTHGDLPLPSPELRHCDIEGPATMHSWRITAYPLPNPIKTINNIHFVCCYQAQDCRIGGDFLFWYFFTQSLKQVFVKDQYIPALIARKTDTGIAYYRRWQAQSGQFQSLIRDSAESMPPAASLSYQPESLLNHCADVLVDELLSAAARDLPAAFSKKIAGDFLETMLLHEYSKDALGAYEGDLLGRWFRWQRKVAGTDTQSALQLGFHLIEAHADKPDDWYLRFFLAAQNDPSFKMDLDEFWAGDGALRKELEGGLGPAVEPRLLVALAQAARIYPKLWQGLDGSEPSGVALSLNDAFEFLKEDAWLLEDVGFKIAVPAWLTPKGRRRAKLRLRTGAQGKSSASAGQSYFSFDSLTDYSYELALGDQTLTPEEWRRLLESKTPLIHFRGQWMELDRDKMQEMLTFLRKQNEAPHALTVQELLRKAAEEDSFEVDSRDSLGQMLERLSDPSRLEPIDNPARLNAELRGYQQRGVAWLSYLESLGLNGCLADDMGLGKTIQVIGLLALERERGQPGPTLLIGPTSVLGNWQKEIEKFAPHLTSIIHHGGGREQDAATFKELCRKHDLVITSYTLARKDIKLLESLHWRRVVLDEAQQIKNPKAAQTKAVLKLAADARLALTGTPMENRLLDLWSIFNFLNPGYLGRQTHFRKTYELPVQRDNDPGQTAVLKKLIQPFILRRLKTDQAIIKDLPDKIENKIYCNLSKEQAALYETVVRDVSEQLDNAEGIQRQGLMLSTLMQLKQICNHPMQFLQDGSAFTPARSHKLERVGEMLEEAIAQGDSALVFTQFTEIGEQLARYLNQEKRFSTYYLHGGTSRAKREAMITGFQDPESEPAIFVLSLKAGGVGITLTRANHVFHFDRWWNPAVENQATDRAFRIGQKKNVFVHKFVTLGTLEERIDQMIADKQKIADGIVGSDEGWLTQLDNQAFRELITLNKRCIMED